MGGVSQKFPKSCSNGLAGLGIFQIMLHFIEPQYGLRYYLMIVEGIQKGLRATWIDWMP